MAKLVEQNLVDMAIDELRPPKVVYREGDIGAISESIKTFGVYKPIGVQEATKEVVYGWHTVLAAAAVGIKSLPVMLLDVTDEEAQRIQLVDNRTAELGHEDNNLLSQLLEELAQSTGLEGIGYDLDDLDALIADRDANYTPLPQSTKGSTMYGIRLENVDNLAEKVEKLAQKKVITSEEWQKLGNK